MSIQCKAAILRESGLPRPYSKSLPLSIEDVTLAAPQPNEVLVKVCAAGLCHSDLSVINGDRGATLPMAIGHEGAGQVVEVGSAVHDVAVDDHVVFQFSPSCGRCRFCQSGRPNLCERAPVARAKGELLSGGTRITDADGNPVRHHVGLSCFSEYVVVDRGSIVPITKDLSLRAAAVFGCAVMTGVGAVVNTADVEPGQSVAVYGLGGVGLSGILGARVAGASTIIAVDLDRAKLDRAAKLGATHCFHATDPRLREQIVDLTVGGVDYAIDCAGSVKALESAYNVTARGGKVVTAGLAPFGAKFQFEQGDLVANEKCVCGSYMGSCVPVRDIPRYVELHQKSQLAVDELIDGFIGFDELNAGFDKLADGNAVRQILLPHGDV